jgi:hypothetical protein
VSALKNLNLTYQRHLQFAGPAKKFIFPPQSWRSFQMMEWLLHAIFLSGAPRMCAGTAALMGYFRHSPAMIAKCPTPSQSIAWILATCCTLFVCVSIYIYIYIYIYRHTLSLSIGFDDENHTQLSHFPLSSDFKCFYNWNWNTHMQWTRPHTIISPKWNSEIIHLEYLLLYQRGSENCGRCYIQYAARTIANANWWSILSSRAVMHGGDCGRRDTQREGSS